MLFCTKYYDVVSTIVQLVIITSASIFSRVQYPVEIVLLMGVVTFFHCLQGLA